MTAQATIEDKLIAPAGTDSSPRCAESPGSAGSFPKVYWHGEGCYCDNVRLPEDSQCPVCDVWPRPEIRTMPNGCRYLPNTKITNRRSTASIPSKP